MFKAGERERVTKKDIMIFVSVILKYIVSVSLSVALSLSFNMTKFS